MKAIRFAFVLLAALIVTSSFGDVLPAREMLQTAQARAGKEGKTVMVIFHASWCGWCKRLDKFMEAEKYAPLFEKNFVVVHLDVLENDAEKKKLENPGGDAVMKELGGEGKGLPFYAFLDKDGKKIGDSLRKGEGDKLENIGYPAAPEEIDHFMKLLAISAKHLSPAEAVAMKVYLQNDKGH